MDVMSESGSILQSKLALMIRELSWVNISVYSISLIRYDIPLNS